MNKVLKAKMAAFCVIYGLLVSFDASAAMMQVLQMDIQPEREQGREKVTIHLSAPAQPRAFILPNPPRMVIDLPPFQWRVPAEKLAQYKGALVKNVRYARFDDQISRVVLDLSQPTAIIPVLKAVESSQANEISYYLQAEGQPLTKAEATSNQLQETLPPNKRSKLPPMQNVIGKDEQPRAGLTPYDMALEMAKKRPELVRPPLASSEPSRGVYAPVAAPNFKVTPTPQQKPESIKKVPDKPLIVIDAGHGGIDPGTIGVRKTKEKNVTLEYAKALKTALENTGRYRVHLTRSDDRFILLRERFHIARRMHANLFISLHADSALNKSARGLSVYTVSEESSDAEAAALAAQENKVDVLADMDLSHQDADVADILIDLAQRETKNKSITLADHLVAALRGKVTLLSNTHRYAGFAVLKAPDIPSALVEIGFLSHPEEEQIIQSRQHREQVVQGLVKGITNYFAQQRADE